MLLFALDIIHHKIAYPIFPTVEKHNNDKKKEFATLPHINPKKSVDQIIVFGTALPLPTDPELNQYQSITKAHPDITIQIEYLNIVITVA